MPVHCTLVYVMNMSVGCVHRIWYVWASFPVTRTLYCQVAVKPIQIQSVRYMWMDHLDNRSPNQAQGSIRVGDSVRVPCLMLSAVYSCVECMRVLGLRREGNEVVLKPTNRCSMLEVKRA